MTKATENAINEKIVADNTTTLEKQLLKTYLAVEAAKE